MNFLIIPIAVFLAIVATLILKEIKSASVAKKILKLLIILFFIAAFIAITYYMHQ